MPELPDVERNRRELVEYAVGAAITDVIVHDSGVLRNQTAGHFVRVLKGRTVLEVERRGKWLVVATDRPIVLVHFGMTGSFEAQPIGAEPHRFDRLTLVTSRGQIAYRDQRKLQGLWLIRNKKQVEQVIGPQGPDAFGLSEAEFTHRIKGSRRALKTMLMDQTVIAGIGNMLSDEILWRAHFHPARQISDLQQRDYKLLARSVQTVLQSSVKAGRIPRSKSWLTSQRGVSKPRCPRCASDLRTSRIAGRTSYWCPICQSR